nr:unnamed protein product [Spirometra erinaceieuropaei]
MGFPVPGSQLQFDIGALNLQDSVNELLKYVSPYLGNKQLAPDSGEEEPSRRDSRDDSEGEDSFRQSFQQLGGSGVLNDIESIHDVWKKLRDESPTLLGDFEKLLTSLAKELTHSKTEYEGLELALKKRINEHEEEVRRLYEEMENQIKQERERLLLQERLKEKEIRESLEGRIKEKDKLLNEILRQHEETQKKLEQLEIAYGEAAQKKEDLDHERALLERRLEETELNLKDCQDYIEVLSKKARDERRSRARAAMELSEGIALERETLVRQLNELREANRRLRDERDEGLLRMSSLNQRSDSIGESLYSAMQFVSQGQTAVDGYGRMTTVRQNVIDRSDRFGANIHHTTATARRGSTMDAYFSQIPTGTFNSTGEGSIIEEEGAGDEFTDDVSDSSVFTSKRKRSLPSTSARTSTERSPRPSPDGAIDQSTMAEDAFLGNGPERVFKVVLIGNSGVGKTSILQTYVTGIFSQTASTVGVDVHVKPMKVDGASVVLQLWDTAGQERYRSITKQYFRKADGVVLVYDVTSELSFLELRGWMQSVADGVDPGTPVMFLANKGDLVKENVPSKVTSQAGERFAKEYDALFFQVSAKTGENIDRAFEALVRCLKQQEDKRFKDLVTFKIPVVGKKKACCMN